jgi:hypothetical protein
MSNNPFRTLVPPNLRVLLDMYQQTSAANLNCHQVGKIVNFDRAKQTASVQIMAQRIVFNKDQSGDALQTEPNLVDYPLLQDCPVFMASGGLGWLTFPISPGDPCLVLFNDRDIDNWFTTGTGPAPNTARLHDLSDGLVLVGFRNMQNPLPEVESDATILRYGGSVVRIQDGNSFLYLGAKATLNSPTAQVEVDTKIGLTNVGYSLKDAIDSLIDALSNWSDTHGDTPSAGTLAALAAVKVKVDGILK